MRRRGLSLAELVMALGLASLSALAMVAWFGGMHKAASEGHSQASATTVAVEALERMQSDPAFLREVTLRPVFEVDEPSHDPAAQRDPRRFRVEVRQAALDPERRYLDVTVLVSWREEKRRREVALETVLTPPDPDL